MTMRFKAMRTGMAASRLAGAELGAGAIRRSGCTGCSDYARGADQSGYDAHYRGLREKGSSGSSAARLLLREAGLGTIVAFRRRAAPVCAGQDPSAIPM